MFKLISPNMLKTYELCPLKFYYKYIKNISMPVNDEIFEFGKNIHALASYFLKNEYIEKMEQALTQKEFEVWAYLKSLKYFNYEVVNSEYTLTVRIENYFFTGRLDALVKNENTYYILDYKTGSAPKNPKYDYQTMIYILAAKEFFNTENIVFVYLDLQNKNELKVKYSSELEQEYKNKLVKIAEQVNLAEKTAKKKKECHCEYSIICV